MESVEEEVNRRLAARGLTFEVQEADMRHYRALGQGS